MSFSRAGDAAERVAVLTIHSAIDAGFTFLDVADFYGSGVSEMNVGQAIKDRRDQVFLSVKFGALVGHTGQYFGIDGRPNSIKNFIAYSLKRLRVDEIDLYQAARVDPDVPYEETIGAIADLIGEGKVRYLGVSEVGAELLRRANAVHPVTALEIEYSLASRFIEPEILPIARELGIGIVSYRILAEGMLTGSLPLSAPPKDRKFLAPRMHGENYERNLGTANVLVEMAKRKGFTPAQLACAWVLSRGKDVVALTGISRPERVAENIQALDVVFSEEEYAELNRAFGPGRIKGERYPEFAMKWAAR